jgi:hypothetical protein
MADEKNSNQNDETAQDARISEEAPDNPAAGEARTPSVSKENTASTDEPEATDIPSANAPDPKATNPEVNPNATEDKPTEVAGKQQKGAQALKEDESGETSPNPKDVDKESKPAAKPAAEKKPQAKAEEGADDKAKKPAAKAKKEKPPAPEDKPFPEFIEQEYIPALQTALVEEGAKEVDLAFVKDKFQTAGLEGGEDCWQVAGSWKNGQRKFHVYFPEEDISKQKAFSCAASGGKASTLESFMIDERRVTLDLLVMYTIQRLNAQKWLTWN